MSKIYLCTNNFYTLLGTVSNKYKMSENFIREFRDHVDWKKISFRYSLSEDFIREFKNKVYWTGISFHEGLSEEFVREFKCWIDFDSKGCKYDYPW